jgi:hypothetical protein
MPYIIANTTGATRATAGDDPLQSCRASERTSRMER